MKKLIFAVTLITLTFLACSKKDDDTPTAPDTTIYEGTWRGTFTGDVNGTWIYNVLGNGTLTGTWTRSGGSMSGGTTSGTVTESGLSNVSFSNGGTEIGQFRAASDTYTGSWQNNDANLPLSGTSSGTKD